MPRFDIFAKRKRSTENPEKPVIFTRNHLPVEFRIQVVWILKDTIGIPRQELGASLGERRAFQFWQQARDTMATEIGRFVLISPNVPPIEDCITFILKAQDVDTVLSLIEICFCFLERLPALPPFRSETVDEAIDDLNHRFLEHSIGYQYQSGRIISVESQYLHQEVVEPAITLLHDANFSGPLEEFLEAHAHYRKGEIKEAITDAGNAFESTMKAICEARGWNHDESKSVASTLIGILFDNQLIPREMQSHFAALRSTLESGVPTVRNSGGRGAHGQGTTPVEVPNYIAAYCLNLTASNIVLMMEAHNSMPSR